VGGIESVGKSRSGYIGRKTKATRRDRAVAPAERKPLEMMRLIDRMALPSPMEDWTHHQSEMLAKRDGGGPIGFYAAAYRRAL
jgi:hypothetical protein